MNTITNYVEIIKTPLISSNDPILWISFIGSIATVISAILMYFSVREMKIQRQQEQQRQELLELKQDIKDNITILIKEIQSKIPKSNTSIDETILYTSNSNIYNALMSMTGQSERTFYNKEIQEIFAKITVLHGFIMFPFEYSNSVIIGIHLILERTGQDLYKALLDEKIKLELFKFIDYMINNLNKSMTQQDKININNHNNEFNYLMNNIKSQNNKDTP